MSISQNKTNYKVLVIGLGHVGNFFAQACPASFTLDATYRRQKPKHENLKNLFAMNIANEGDINFSQLIADQYQAVVWMLPPIAHYPQLLAQANVHFSPQTPWIFVSSTSVYREGEITEQSPRDGNSGNAPLLIACEQYLESIQRPCCIVRPSGLFDDIRRPGGFFKNSNSIPNASSPINLVHSQDVARFLWHVILRQLWGEQFNLSCDDHPLKKDFYAPLLLKNYGKKIALDETSKTTKIISNLKSRQTGFEYLYPSLAKYQASI